MTTPTEPQPQEAICVCGHAKKDHYIGMWGRIVHCSKCLPNLERSICDQFTPAPAASTKEEWACPEYPKCDGTGGVMISDGAVEDEYDCPDCGGRGKLPPSATFKPAGEDKCVRCGHIRKAHFSGSHRCVELVDGKPCACPEFVQPPSAAPSAEVASETTVGRMIGKLATQWKFGNIDAKEFATSAQAEIDKLGEQLAAAREALTAQQQRGNEYKAIAQTAEVATVNAATRIERLTEELAKANAATIDAKEEAFNLRMLATNNAADIEKERAKCAELEEGMLICSNQSTKEQRVM